MTQTSPVWRVLQLQQDLARKNARQALLVIQQRRRELAEADEALPLQRRSTQRTRATRVSSQTGSADS